MNFIIGSSYLVTLPFFLSVIKNKHKRYPFEYYALIAPVYLGLMNQLGHSCNLNTLTLTIISAIIVISFSLINKAYNYTQREWAIYITRIFMMHFFAYSISRWITKQLSY